MSGATTGNDTLTGTAGNDVIDLLAGNDTYLGLDGNDAIQGNDGNDIIYGGNGADSIAGGNGDDWIYGELGNDSIDAGAGTADRILYNQTGGEAITATINSIGGNTGINTATVSTATQGTDSIQGFEALIGSINGDLITVTTAATQNFNLFLFGAAGNDTIIDGYRQNGVFADYNTTSTSLTSGISVDLTSGIATDGFGGTDSLVGITAVNGTSFVDTMLGSASNDRFRSGAGNDLMDGRGGTGDMVDYAANAASQAVSVNIATGRANDGWGGTDTLVSIEQARGGVGNDVLVGDGNNNTFRGNGGSDTIDGAGGTGDAADYAFATAAVSVNLATGQAQDGQGGVDSLSGIEYVYGSAYDDTLIGGSGNDSLRGNAGTDSLVGGNGNDTLDAGSGLDATLFGGAGNDLYMLNGEAYVSDTGGSDTVSFLGGGVETILASAGDLDGSPGIEAIDLAGTGKLLGLTAAAVIRFSDTDVLRVYGSGNDSLVFEDTGWVRTGSSGGFDTLSNSVGNATVIASTGLASSDIGSVINLGDGNDTLGGSNGADTIDGGNGSDIIVGFGGNDSILSGDGADTVLGGLGNDQIQGGNGNDSLSGGDGDDTLVGGSDDTLLGGAGNDLFVAGSTSLSLRINDSGGSDTLSFSGATGGSISAAALGSVNGIEAINLAGGGNTLNLSASRVLALSDTDVLRVFGNGSDRLVFDDAASWTRGATTAGFVTFTNGSATVIAAESLEPVVSGPTAGNDTLTGTSGNDVIDLLAGSDSYLGLDGNDSILGNDGNDTIYGGNGADSIAGGNGDDQIFGEAGSDTIDAGAGTADRLHYSQTGGEAITATITSSGGNTGINTATVSTATQGADSILGFEVLVGSNNGDLITVTTAATQNASLFLFGAAGNDTIIDNYRQSDVFADYNTSSTNLTSGVSVDLTSGIATDGFGGTDSLVGITAVNGTRFADSMLGSASNDRFRGWQGNDLLDGRGGTGDMVDYANNAASQAVSVNLETGRANDGLGGTDTLINIELARGGAGDDVLIGDSNNNTFRGNGGNDTIDGAGGTGDGSDYLFATAAVSVNLATGRAQDGQGGIDSLTGIENVFGSAFGDTLIGSNGNDNLRGNSGNDTIDGAGGTFDTSDYSAATAAVSANLGTGQAQDGQGGVDSLIGIEVIWGSAYADTLIGGALNDNLRGNAGNDSLDGGAGTADVAQYANATTGITVKMGTGIVQDGQGGTDNLTGIEQIWGSSFNDSMLGGNGNDFFVGATGADTFEGGLGDDAVSYSFYPSSTPSNATQGVSVDLSSGTARDAFGGVDSLVGIEIIYGSSFADTITGGAANETIYGNGGSDSLSGGAGNDQIYAFGPSDVARLDGGAGNDLLQGSAANDTMSGGDDADTLFGNGGADSLIGGNGSDYLYAFGTIAVTLAGGAGNDQLAGATGNDTLDGGDDADTLYGQGGADSYSGGAGADHLYAGNGADTMDGGIGNDSLYGNGGADSLSGGEGDDEISAFGFADAVRFDGGAGNDELYDGSGADTMAGGAGNDTIYSTAGADSANGGDGDDNIDAGGSVVAVRLDGGAGNDTLVAGGGNGQYLDGGGDADSMVGGSGAGQTLFGDIGNDTLVAGAGANQGLYGSVGDDSLIGGSGADTLDGGLNEPGNDSLSGGEGNDVLHGRQGSNLLIGGNGDDSLYADQTGNSTFQGDDGNDLLSGGDAADTAAGGNGADFLYGNGGADSLNGGAGADTLHAGNGNDTLSGGDGTDSLVGAEGNDLYFVSDVLDRIIETSGGGADTVITSVSFSIPDQVDALQIAAGVTGITLTGGAGNDMLVGNGLANNLNGGAGDDVILAGNVTLADIYALFGP